MGSHTTIGRQRERNSDTKRKGKHVYMRKRIRKQKREKWENDIEQEEKREVNNW